ncbi:helix-turn-helix domain-containing protein [Embleya sp. NPDC127516]|uniref:AraC-like ligand-binding domain-containing protein n=1 Tax=Embleya sp. NPDC127516 TaxID=3363990 RepID=UPI0038166CD8
MTGPREPDTPRSRKRSLAGLGSGNAPRHRVGSDGRRRSTPRPGAAPSAGSAPDVDTWREILRDAIFQLDATPFHPPDPRGYTGWVNVHDFGAVSISDVASDPVQVARTPRLIKRNPVDMYLLLLAVRPSRAAAGTYHALLRPGDAVLVDSTQPYSLTADAFAHYLSIHVPRAALRRDLRTAPAVGRVIPAHDPTLRVLTAVVTELACSPLGRPSEVLAELGHTTYELLVSTLRTAAGPGMWSSDVQLSRRAQSTRMREFIRLHLADPDLSPRTLAAAFGVSTRYVDLVFREGDSSPAEFIRETRLDQARRRLADPRQRHLSVSSVGQSVGFTDPGVLIRGFRRRYGVTPGEYRRTRLPEPQGNAMEFVDVTEPKAQMDEPWA